jgi:hypothetical protein
MNGEFALPFNLKIIGGATPPAFAEATDGQAGGAEIKLFQTLEESGPEAPRPESRMIRRA